MPQGPRRTQEEQRQQAHGRIARGARCFMAGQCQDVNAYRCDKTLAVPVEAALQAVSEGQAVAPLLGVDTRAKPRYQVKQP